MGVVASLPQHLSSKVSRSHWSSLCIPCPRTHHEPQACLGAPARPGTGSQNPVPWRVSHSSGSQGASPVLVLQTSLQQLLCSSVKHCRLQGAVLKLGGDAAQQIWPSIWSSVNLSRTPMEQGVREQPGWRTTVMHRLGRASCPTMRDGGITQPFYLT